MKHIDISVDRFPHHVDASGREIFDLPLLRLLALRSKGLPARSSNKRRNTKKFFMSLLFEPNLKSRHELPHQVSQSGEFLVKVNFLSHFGSPPSTR